MINSDNSTKSQNRESTPTSFDDPIHHDLILEDGKIEEKIQVDRKKLENMIKTPRVDIYIAGEESFGNEAEQYFENVEEMSGAKIIWPTRLKIGARTKKDPYVKIYGYPDEVKLAQKIISRDLKIKKDRIILKMEISHYDHSHIIGRGGRNTQMIMAETRCHIHFPDSNKHIKLEKNDQVSIAGCYEQVEMAREKLRQITPVTINIEFVPPINSKILNDIIKYLNNNDVIIQYKRTYQFEQRMLHVITSIKDMLSEYEISLFMKYETKFDLRASLLNDLNIKSEVALISQACKVKITPYTYPCSGLKIEGEPRAIFIARKMVIGLYPLMITFDRGNNCPNLNYQTLEKKYNVSIYEKKKYVGDTNVTTIVIKGMENSLTNIYLIREIILFDYETSLLGSPLQKSLSSNTKFINLQNLFKEVSLNENNHDDNNYNQSNKSLYQNNKNDTNYLKNNKINKSSIDDYFNDEIEKTDKLLYDSNVKYIESPTNGWYKYGLSNSMPANVLKAKKNNLWDTPNSLIEVPSPEESFFSVTGNGTVFSEIEERNEDNIHSCKDCNNFDMSCLKVELESIWNASKTNTAMFTQPTFNDNNINHNTDIDNLNYLNTYFTSYPIFNNHEPFTVSTSIYETIPSINSNIEWDINIITTPEIVLTLLDCKEYISIFREQEIDMGAFLLMDENNLKQLGIKTIGHRKKIFGAILKLRESVIAQDQNGHLKSMVLLSDSNNGYLSTENIETSLSKR
ncbi:Protein bicaudal C homolog 1 [Strongyloides ratti]|uniref:Protein bicaudal C homolog 1 n=1 Tax=Strongyloides ratti TaxID=34506 RepID=A0A090LUE9_STRRB|nr:Protein bicaudal C homolog 1 [Strongyloides ratti]CEF71224.1 Protein bicaudal C homolog 1 [Strongyloides ratti]